MIPVVGDSFILNMEHPAGSFFRQSSSYNSVDTHTHARNWSVCFSLLWK